MGGLTFEKLIIIALIAAFIIGPDKLPKYASKAAAIIRKVKTYGDDAKNKMKSELGEDNFEELKKYNPSNYTPSAIVKQTLFTDETNINEKSNITTKTREELISEAQKKAYDKIKAVRNNSEMVISNQENQELYYDEQAT